MGAVATVGGTVIKGRNSMNNMFAPMSVRLAEMGERDRKELAEARERERLEREAAAARDKTPEQLDEEFRQRAMATAPVSFGTVEARAQAAADKIEREKQEHMADIKLLGAVV